MRKELPVECAVLKCKHKALVGGHVTPCTEDEGLWLIMPLCSNHNSSFDERPFEVVKSLRARWVYPDPLPTCKRIE
jgi:hypothetical protein